MTYALFLDDERTPPVEIADRCCVARTVVEALELIRRQGMPNELFLDHDLGADQPSSMTFLHDIIDGHLDSVLNLHAVQRVTIISANPIGAENLLSLWDSIALRIGSSVRAVRAPATNWKRQ